MKTNSIRERLLATTIITGVATLALIGQAAAQPAAPTTPVPTAGGSANSPQPAFGPPAAGTQTTNAEGQATTSVQEVVITGSRIPQANLSSTSPISVVSNTELKYEGTTDAIQALDQLPQTSGDLNNTPNPLGQGEGITTVNLRGLGSARTLVLQDGKRLQPGDPTVGGVVDIDQIPSQLIDRVEVLTGGASAVYGSDAIAGVVNFVMKHDYQGVQFDVQGGFAQHDNNNSFMQGLENAAGFPAPSGSNYDGETWNASAIFGANTPDGKGNVEGFISYRHQDPVSEGARDYAGCLLAVSTSTGSNPYCDGSPNSNQVIDAIGGGVYNVGGTSLLPDPTSGLTPPARFNSSPYEFLQRQDERYQAGFFGHYQVQPWADVYNDFSFMHDISSETIAPSGSFEGDATTPGDALGAIQIPCNDPLLSAQEIGTLCTANGLGPTDNAEIYLGRRNIEGGPRDSTYKHDSFRDVLGVRGDLGSAWHYDIYAQFGYTEYEELQTGYFSNSRLANALNVVPDPATGAAECSTLAQNPSCVPYNIWMTGGVTPAALAYLNDYGETNGSTQEQVAHVDITGELGQYGIKSPFSDKGVGINVGTEYRREALVDTPDETILSGDLAGGSGAAGAVNAAFDLYELFGELQLPIAHDQPFIKDLSFDGGYRFSQYSTVGDISSYKLSFEYAPVSDVRFRASFQQAVRAPNAVELFTPSNVTQSASLTTDPCAAISSPGGMATATLAQCERTGVTAAEYGNGIALGQTVGGVAGTNTIVQCPAAQCGTTTGGNASLAAETSRTVSYGGIFTPRWLPNFSLSIDYYDIDVKNAVESLSDFNNVVFDQCLNGTTTALCQFIHRSPTGFLFGDNLATGGYVIGTTANVGYLKTTGIDFEANYRYNLADLGHGDIGRLLFNFDGTYLQHFITSPLVGLGNYDCAGYDGGTCGFNPHFRSKLRITYQSPWRWTLSAQWRYIGGQKLDQNQSNPLLQYSSIGVYDYFDANTPAISYLDISTTYTIRDGLTLRAGVNNILDQDPPILSQYEIGSGAPNALPEYDLLGREVFVGLNADF